MMAAGRAAERGRRVLLLEKNAHLGEKLKITGGGRCNIANAEENTEALLAHYGKAKQFLYTPFAQFGVEDTFTFFETRGVPLKVEAGKRAFPASEKAGDVLRVLEKYLAEGNVTVRTHAPVSGIAAANGRVEKVTVGKEEFSAASYILATGGTSHPETGSTGDGFFWLTALGHHVEKPTPTLVPLAVREKWVRELSGVSLADIKISFFVGEKKRLSLKGKILFTHFGISGPLILNAAGKVADMLHEGAVTARIDAFPDTDLGTLDKKITHLFDAHKNKMLKNIFRDIAPEGSGDVLLALLPAIHPDTKVHSITKAARRQIVELLKSIPLTIAGLMGYDRAVVADGGLVLAEVDRKTMRSALYDNLYVTGDLLHIRRPSGGYSLQLCWTTGYVAGSHA